MSDMTASFAIQTAVSKRSDGVGPPPGATLWLCTHKKWVEKDKKGLTLEWLGGRTIYRRENERDGGRGRLTDRFSGSGRRIKDLHERYDTNETGAGGNSWHSEALSKSQLDKKFVGRSE